MASTAGAIRTWMGDYQFAFLSGGVIAMIAAGLALQIKMKPKEITTTPSASVQPAGA
jgi:hypothetical protein